MTKSLRHLLALSKILKKKRIDQGALLLASSEVRFNVDSETADPIDVEVKQMRETNSMVEEFMLAANISSAKKSNCLYRSRYIHIIYCFTLDIDYKIRNFL